MTFKTFKFSIRLLIVQFFSWRFELKLMKEQKDFQPDETYLVMECLKCSGMASVSTNGFKGIIPDVPVYSSEVRQCSQCMDRHNFNWLTSQ